MELEGTVISFALLCGLSFFACFVVCLLGEAARVRLRRTAFAPLPCCFQANGMNSVLRSAQCLVHDCTIAGRGSDAAFGAVKTGRFLPGESARLSRIGPARCGPRISIFCRKVMYPFSLRKMGMNVRIPITGICLLLMSLAARAEDKPSFVDGFHGGVEGHYPRGTTRFIVDTMRKHPRWKICLEIEPATWQSERAQDAVAYQDFKQLLADFPDRVEFVSGITVNPTSGMLTGRALSAISPMASRRSINTSRMFGSRPTQVKSPAGQVACRRFSSPWDSPMRS